MRVTLLVALCALLPLSPVPGFSFSLFSKEDPRVKAANRAYGAGKYEDALRGYEDALRDHPSAPELQFDRGNALFKMGRQAEAREAYLSALAAKDSELKAQDYYNMGNALWGLDKNDEAAQAYQRALLIDPNLEEARHNLELLLAPPPDGGQGDGGRADAGGDGGQSDAGQGDGGRQQDGGSPNPQRGDAGAPDAGNGRGEDGGQREPKEPKPNPDGGSGQKPQELDKLQAEQLLNALREREKNLQLWKFRMKQQRPKESEKDW